MGSTRTLAALIGALSFGGFGSGQEPAPGGDGQGRLLPEAQAWRAADRFIDTHVHVGMRDDLLQRAARLFDEAGIGLALNLSGGTTVPRDGGPSDFERNLAFQRERVGDRMLLCMNLDYGGWDGDDFCDRAVHQVEEGFRLGAVALKEYKRLGLGVRDGAGKLVAIDDPKLDPMWRRCGELGLPVIIHTSDPKAFWEPFDETNERWEELKDHRGWWFGDPNVYPSREALLEARNRVIERHPDTTFVCVHFANNPEDVVAVGRWLDRYPNMIADLAARVPELGRHDPEVVRKVFARHQDRILFGTDFMVYDRLTLGSGGSGPAPTDEDALKYYHTHWRWLETDDEGFEHMTPIQGRWTIDGIGLPAGVLRKIYFDNARRVFARFLPVQVVRARRIREEFDGAIDHPAWRSAEPVTIETSAFDGVIRPELSTEVRLLWTPEHLYLRYRVPYTELTVFEPAILDAEREGLWDRDVVEAFIGATPDRPGRYLEFEVAPTGEQLDLWIDQPDKDLAWNSGFTSKVRVDEGRHVWFATMRVPLASFGAELPAEGTRWRANLFRCDRAHDAFLSWRAVLQRTYHVPGRFGILEFAGP